MYRAYYYSEWSNLIAVKFHVLKETPHTKVHRHIGNYRNTIYYLYHTYASSSSQHLG